MSKQDLNEGVGRVNHQGVVLDCSKASYLNLPKNHLLSPSLRVVVALDQVQDPNNLGAILRSCAFFGAGVLVSGKNSSGLTPAVSKASSGAMETLLSKGLLRSSANLPNALRVHRDEEWLVVGTSVKGRDVQSVHALDQSRGDKGLILCMGNEGVGLRTSVQQQCSHWVSIPSQGGNQHLSLNVSVATGVLLSVLA